MMPPLDILYRLHGFMLRLFVHGRAEMKATSRAAASSISRRLAVRIMFHASC